MKIGLWIDVALVLLVLGGALGSLVLLAWRRRQGGDRWTLLDVAITFACFVGAASISSLLAFHWTTGHYVPVGEPPILPAVAATGLGSGLAVLGVFLRARPRDLALGGDIPWSMVALAFTLVLPFLLFSAAWVSALHWLGMPPEPQRLVDWFGAAAAGALPVALYAVVYAPFAEELLFRGFLLPPLIRRVGVAPGLVLGGAFFGLLHASDPSAMVPLALLGVLLGWLRHRSGSLWPPLTLHIVNNSVALGITLWTS